MKSRRVVMHVVYLTLLSLLLPSKQSLALDASGVSTPPPVSGRRLSDPASILPADVLARVELLRANVEFVRRFVGRQPAPEIIVPGEELPMDHEVSCIRNSGPQRV